MVTLVGCTSTEIGFSFDDSKCVDDCAVDVTDEECEVADDDGADVDESDFLETVVFNFLRFSFGDVVVPDDEIVESSATVIIARMISFTLSASFVILCASMYCEARFFRIIVLFVIL